MAGNALTTIGCGYEAGVNINIEVKMEFLLSTSSQILSLYTILFVMYSILEITGALPQEMRSAGITLPALFSGYYGHEVD